MQRFPLLSAFGYDPGLLSGLSQVERQRIATVAGGWLLSLALLAWPAGYTLWLVEHSLGLALGVAIATFLLVLNLLRVVTAGGGVQAGVSPAAVRGYRPGLAPATFLFVLGVLFAQPAQLPLRTGELDPLVDAYRNELVVAHERRSEHRDDHHRAVLSECDFMVKRLTLLWEDPAQALRFTGFYCLLVLLPALFSQFVALDAIRAYELARYRVARARVAKDREQTARAIRDALGRFSSYVRDAERSTSLPQALYTERRRAGQLSLKWRAAP